jgi:hypothetical protein
MKTIYKIILVNLGALVGYVAALFTLPYNTSFTLLGVMLLITLVLINVAVFVLPGYRRKRSIPSADPKFTTAKLIIIWVLALLGLLWNWSLWHHP